MPCKLRGFLRICKSYILAIWALLRIIVQIYTFLLISQNRHFFYFLKQHFFNNKSPVYECFDKPLRRVCQVEPASGTARGRVDGDSGH